MGYVCKIIADSVSPSGARITTMQLRFPRFLLAEFNTYRAFSRNARSSRAVPTEKLLAEIEQDPVMPLFWGEDRHGMQATEEMDEEQAHEARCEWLSARDEAVNRAVALVRIGAHKQIVNRLLEPYMWADVVVTSTSFDNAFSQRCHPEAQPEIQKIFVMMARALRDSTPAGLAPGEWHLPYMSCDEQSFYRSLHISIALSVVRCARVSYKPHDGTNPELEKERRRYGKLLKNSHWSPFEHQAECLEDANERSGNFVGWRQYRQMLPINVHTAFDFSGLDRLGERDFITPN